MSLLCSYLKKRQSRKIFVENIKDKKASSSGAKYT